MNKEEERKKFEEELIGYFWPGMDLGKEEFEYKKRELFRYMWSRIEAQEKQFIIRLKSISDSIDTLGSDIREVKEIAESTNKLLPNFKHKFKIGDFAITTLTKETVQIRGYNEINGKYTNYKCYSKIVGITNLYEYQLTEPITSKVDEK